MLQRHRRERDEPLGVRRAGFGELFVLDADQLARDVTIGLVPVGIDAQRLDVDTLLVHRLDPVRGPRHQQRLRLDLAPHQRHRLGDGAVRVDVDRLDAPAVDDDLAAARLRLGRRGGGEIAADEGDAGHSAGGFLDELTASAHRALQDVRARGARRRPKSKTRAQGTTRAVASAGPRRVRSRAPSGPKSLCRRSHGEHLQVVLPSARTSSTLGGHHGTSRSATW